MQLLFHNRITINKTILTQVAAKGPILEFFKEFSRYFTHQIHCIFGGGYDKK